MRIIVCVLFGFMLFCSPNLFRQNKIVSAKGFIFLSESYEKLLDSLKFKDNIDIVYLPDIFFPIKEYDNKNLFENFLKAQKGLCI
jgi:hypothetical protein